ncbi:MAG: CIA30 family protein [Actinomycetota bacterium]
MHRLGLGLLVIVLLGAACGTDADATEDAAPSTAPAGAADGESTGSTTVTTTAATTPSSTTTATAPKGGDDTSATAADETPEGSVDDCRLVADVEDPAELARWRIVNDGVMGGRSSAEATVADSVLTLFGQIVTDGGGFSSVRLDLDEPLGEVTSLVFRVRTDGRPYEVTLADAAPDRDRRVSFQAPIEAVGDGAWEEVTVELGGLQASVFGQSVAVAPFEPTAAVEVGVILADGTDGPFRFELDWIRACR